VTRRPNERIASTTIDQADFGIGETAVATRGGIGDRAVRNIGGQRSLETIDRGAVESVEFGDDGGGFCHLLSLRQDRYSGKTQAADTKRRDQMAAPSLSG
jgi:hypothetical protein